eukprot:9451733-Alexandrium_andersonii.AAC.1
MLYSILEGKVGERVGAGRALDSDQARAIREEAAGEAQASQGTRPSEQAVDRCLRRAAFFAIRQRMLQLYRLWEQDPSWATYEALVFELGVLRQ